MRIIGGKYKGKRLFTPENRNIRPTSDRLRERLFNIIEHGDGPDLRGARIADIFAGTGALGLEALSRGAEHVTFIEQDAEACKLIKRNIHALKADDHCRISRQNAASLPPARRAFDYIFLDPPYGTDLLQMMLEKLPAQGWAGPNSIIIAECKLTQSIAAPEQLYTIDSRNHGISRLTFYKLQA